MLLKFVAMNVLTSRPKEPYLVIGPRRSGRTLSAREIAGKNCTDLENIVEIQHNVSDVLSVATIKKQINRATEIILIDQIDDLTTQIHWILKLASDGIKPHRSKTTIYPLVIAVVLGNSDRNFQSYLPFNVKRCHAITTFNGMSPEPPKVQLEFTPEEARKLSHDLSNMLCWWQGFRAGIRTIDEFSSIIGVADNGIKAAQTLNEKIKSKITREPF